jgi:AcrR family transcriptional regulator
LNKKERLVATKETKERILDAAEALLAQEGFAGVTMRAIATSADVNLASINYHFGSKEALIQSVFTRHVAPINRARLELLDGLEREAGNGPLPVESIVRAFIRPLLTLRQVHGADWHTMRRLLGHTMGLPNGETRDAFLSQFGEVVRRFTAALGRALPHLGEQEVLWRLLFVVGTIVHTLAMADDMPRISLGRCDVADPETTERWMIPFLAAGMRAPAAESRLEAKDA